jgi:hypothetical protein
MWFHKTFSLYTTTKWINICFILLGDFAQRIFLNGVLEPLLPILMICFYFFWGIDVHTMLFSKSLPHTFYYIHFTIYILLYTFYYIHFTIYILLYTFYYIHFNKYNLQNIFYNTFFYKFPSINFEKIVV